MVLNVVPPLLFSGFLSIGRVTSLLFPLFMYLAAVLFFTWHRFI